MNERKHHRTSLTSYHEPSLCSVRNYILVNVKGPVAASQTTDLIGIEVYLFFIENHVSSVENLVKCFAYA